MADDEKKPQGIRFNAEINMGAVVQAAVVLLGLVTWALTSANRAQTAAEGLVALQVKMDATFGALQQAVDKNINQLSVGLTTQNGDLRRDLGDLRQQIASLPDQRARLDGLVQWRTDVEARFGNQEARLRALENSAAGTQVQLEGLNRAVNVPLPRQR